mgnify:CR=1 FL=1
MKISVLFILLTFVFACSKDTEPYQENMKYVFSSKYSNSEFKDKLYLQKQDVDGFVSKILWDSEIRQDPGSSTGISLEARFSNTRSSIELPTPMGEYLNMTGLLPNPRVQFPIRLNDSIDSHHKIDYKHNPYNGLLVDGYLKVIGRKYYDKKPVSDTCWVIEANKYSSKDTSATFYFNEKLGFVYFNYQLGNDSIVIALDSIIYNN